MRNICIIQTTIKHISKNEKLQTDNENEIDKSQDGNSSKVAPKDNNTNNQSASVFMHNLVIATKK